ncbi:DgyrCDS11105 [Dimorphilus gyrociliatus]|uniref:DgyrCDS11105 n=1 Tax=Dimorphilus gyrociliatus TaxID=2664684 RepID=A0A7I8W299_9ANNE|nr:DgyrCDS11105 [Dimorphilus gyrociliatus]
MDPKYIEHDAYTMFCQIMKTVEPWYISKELTSQQVHVRKLSLEPFSKQHDVSPSNAIVFKLARIHDHLLKRFDPELRKCLEDNDIIPQFYGIRWIRLLFGREFPMQDLLVIWDALFSDGLSLDLVDYIFTAMLIYIRDQLISRDYASCLSVLMRYPPAPDIQYFIDLALHLRDPKHYQKPVSATFMNHAPRKSGAVTNEPVKSGESAKRTSVISKFSFKKERKGNERPNSLLVLNSTLQENALSSPDDRYQKRKSSVPTPILSSQKISNFSKFPSLSASSTNLAIPNDSLYQNNSNLSILNQDSKPPFPSGSLSTPIQSKRINHSAKKITTVDREHAILTGRLKDKEILINFCSLQLNEHIEKLKKPYKEIDLEDILRNLSKTRDILNGTIKLPSNLLEKENVPRVNPIKEVELRNVNNSQNLE